MFRLRWEVWVLHDKEKAHILINSDKSEKLESSLNVSIKITTMRKKKFSQIMPSYYFNVWFGRRGITQTMNEYDILHFG